MNTKHEAATPPPAQDHLRELTNTEMKAASGGAETVHLYLRSESHDIVSNG